MSRSDLELAVALARALHGAGAPSWRVEQGVEALGRARGRRLTCFAVPTGLQLSDGERVCLVRADGGEVDLTAQHALDRAVRAPAPRRALQQALAGLGHRPPLASRTSLLAHTAVATGAALLLDGQVGTVLGAAFGGLFTGLIGLQAARQPGTTARVLPLVASLASTVLAHAPLAWGLPTQPSLAAICGIIYLLPGLGLTIGVGEVAAGHSSAGAARLTSAGVMLLLLGLGVAAGAELRPALPLHAGPPLWGAATLGLLLTGGGLGVLFRARRSQLPWVGVGVGLAGALPALLQAQAPAMVAFVTAGALGLAGNLLHLHNRTPAQVLTLPGILMLVPGGSSLRAVGALLRHDLRGIDFLADSLATSGALVAGLLVAGLLLPPALSPAEGPAAAQPGG